VVQVIPLLVETGQAGDFDQVVVVHVHPQVQLARLQQRDGFDPAEAAARIAAQASPDRRLEAADVVIDNSGSPEELAAAVDRLWARWRQRQ
jgi:dephospho-CoA kinase